MRDELLAYRTMGTILLVVGLMVMGEWWAVSAATLTVLLWKRGSR